MASRQIPKYRVTEKCYFNMQEYEKGSFLETDDEPAYYMIPANQAARDRVAAAGPMGQGDPLDKLPTTLGEDSTDPDPLS